MSRIARKEIKHDEFVDGTMRVMRVIEENPRPLLYSVLGILAIVVVITGGWTYVHHQMDQAADLLSRGEAAYFGQVVTDGGETSQDPYRPTFESDEARLAAAVDRLKEAEEGMGSAASVARFLRGSALLEQGALDESVAELEIAAAELGDDPSLGAAVKALYATALERSGANDRARELWVELADEGSGYPRDLALFGLSRALRGTGETEKARETLQELVDLYQESPLVERALQALSEL